MIKHTPQFEASCSSVLVFHTILVFFLLIWNSTLLDEQDQRNRFTTIVHLWIVVIEMVRPPTSISQCVLLSVFLSTTLVSQNLLRYDRLMKNQHNWIEQLRNFWDVGWKVSCKSYELMIMDLEFVMCELKYYNMYLFHAMVSKQRIAMGWFCKSAKDSTRL